MELIRHKENDEYLNAAIDTESTVIESEPNKPLLASTADVQRMLADESKENTDGTKSA